MKTVCPICRKETLWKGNPHRPFCSERCRWVDLASWIGGQYAIRGEAFHDPNGEGNSKVETAENNQVDPREPSQLYGSRALHGASRLARKRGSR